MSLAASSSAPPRSLALLGLSAFLLLGLIYPILGPALPRLSEQFELRATGAALLLSFNSAGAFLGVVITGLVSRRLSPQRRSLIAALILALGSVALALAPSFGLALAAALALGFGFGMLDLTMNVWISTSYAERSAAVLNLLSASFGVGAVLAPLAVGLAGGNFRLPLLGCAALATALLLVLLLTPARSPMPPAALTAAPALRHSRWLLGGFVALFLLYVAVEGGVGAWEVTHLKATLSISTARAAQLSALFWVSFTLGRLISAPLALRLAPAPLIIAALSLAALSLALAAVPTFAALAYTLTGFFLAPVFTTGLVWLTRVMPGGAAPTFVFAGSFLGPVMFSPLIGSLRDAFGPAAIPLTLLGITLAALALVVGLSRRLST